MIKVRYAPSPTGPHQHVGGVRTALFNWLFAKHSGGKFFIRIEDTDQERYNPKAVTDLLQSFTWLGLDWDEGPTVDDLLGLDVSEDMAARYGKASNTSFVQSKRASIYNELAHRLIEEGKAYPVFSDESLEQSPDIKVQEARMKMQVFRWREAGSFMISKAMATGRPYHVRLKMPREDTAIECMDYLRGSIFFPYRKLYDPVILKTPKDGKPAMPSYHLAHVIDDHLMETSHVLRGEEWLSSLPYHTYLWKCFNWDAPVYCHLPVILNPTGKGKMSKRETKAPDGSIVPVFVTQYKELGFIPDALINFMALVGWNPGNGHEIINKDELIDLFSLDRINRTGAAWDYRKLRSINQRYIQMMDEDTFADLAESYIGV